MIQLSLDDLGRKKRGGGAELLESLSVLFSSLARYVRWGSPSSSACRSCSICSARPSLSLAANLLSLSRVHASFTHWVASSAVSGEWVTSLVRVGYRLPKDPIPVLENWVCPQGRTIDNSWHFWMVEMCGNLTWTAVV